MSGKKKTFEESVKRIEEIVESLEKEMNSLEDSIRLYEEGIKLIQFCEKELKKAEGKITQLTRDKTGEVKEISFPDNPENQG